MMAERIAYGVSLLLAVVAWFEARQFPRPQDAHSGPGSFPAVLSLVLFGLALAGLLGTWKAKPPPASAAVPPGEGRHLVLLAGATALYLLAMPWLGFVSATALLGMVALLVLGYRHPARALAAGFIAAFALYALFGVLMNVALPKGWIG